MRLFMGLFVIASLIGYLADYPNIAIALLVFAVLIGWYLFIGDDEEVTPIQTCIEVIRIYEHDDHIVADRITVDIVSAGNVFRDCDAEYYYRMDYFYREGALAQSHKNKFIHIYNSENPFAQKVLLNQELNRNKHI